LIEWTSSTQKLHTFTVRENVSDCIKWLLEGQPENNRSFYQGILNRQEEEEKLGPNKFESMQQTAIKLKDDANALFNKKELQGALQLYYKSLVACPLKDISTRTALYSNISECYLRLKNWKLALTNAAYATSLTPKHKKSMWRKVIALHGLKMFDYARIQLDACETQFKLDSIESNLEVQTDLIAYTWVGKLAKKTLATKPNLHPIIKKWISTSWTASTEEIMEFKSEKEEHKYWDKQFEKVTSKQEPKSNEKKEVKDDEPHNVWDDLD